MRCQFTAIDWLIIAAIIFGSAFVICAYLEYKMRPKFDTSHLDDKPGAPIQPNKPWPRE